MQVVSEIKWSDKGPPRGQQLRRWWRVVWRAARRVQRRMGWTLPLLVGLALGVAGVAVASRIIDGVLDDPQVAGQPAENAPDVIITVTNSYLEQRIRESIQRGAVPLPLRDPRVVTKPGTGSSSSEMHIFVTGRLDLPGRDVNGVIELRPILTAEGKVQTKVVDAKLGVLPVPGNIERLVEGPVNERMEAALAGYPAKVLSVTAVPEGVQATAKLLPRTPTPAPAAPATVTATPAQ